jgi:hypothetical protein
MMYNLWHRGEQVRDADFGPLWVWTDDRETMDAWLQALYPWMTSLPVPKGTGRSAEVADFVLPHGAFALLLYLREVLPEEATP